MPASRGGRQRIPRPPLHALGEPPPWARIAAESRRFTLADVRERLAALPPAPAPTVGPGTILAAVLVPLFERDGEPYLVLTKRPETMPSHRGEIAFPGGKYSPALDRDLRATALREAYEEVGLVPEAVEIVTQLEPLGTVASQFAITPYVGFLPEPPVYDPDPREVDRVFEVSLSELLDDEVYHEERWTIGAEADLIVHFYELTDETVWGATARILTGFLAHLVEGR